MNSIPLNGLFSSSIYSLFVVLSLSSKKEKNSPLISLDQNVHRWSGIWEVDFFCRVLTFKSRLEVDFLIPVKGLFFTSTPLYSRTPFQFWRIPFFVGMISFQKKYRRILKKESYHILISRKTGEERRDLMKTSFSSYHPSSDDGIFRSPFHNFSKDY